MKTQDVINEALAEAAAVAIVLNVAQSQTPLAETAVTLAKDLQALDLPTIYAKYVKRGQRIRTLEEANRKLREKLRYARGEAKAASKFHYLLPFAGLLADLS